MTKQAFAAIVKAEAEKEAQQGTQPWQQAVTDLIEARAVSEDGPTAFLEESKLAIQAAGGDTLEAMISKLQVFSDN